MKIIINGAAGFLGRHIIKTIGHNDEIQVLALTSRTEQLNNEFEGYNNIKIAGSNNADFWEKADVFINCAFPRNYDAEKMAPGLDFVSSQLTKAVAADVKAVINISSQSVYDPKRKEPADENTSIVLRDNYAIGKYATELLTNAVCREIPHTNIRLASLIGPNFDQRLVNKFAKSIKSGNNLLIKNGSQRFGFLDVQDAADALTLMLTSSPDGWRERYVLGNHEAYSLKDIADVVINVGKEFGYNGYLEIVPSGDHMNTTLNPVTFEKDFGWRARYSLEETVRLIYKLLP